MLSGYSSCVKGGKKGERLETYAAQIVKLNWCGSSYVVFDVIRLFWLYKWGSVNVKGL